MEGTQATVEQLCKQLLNYTATHPDTTFQFTASKMILNKYSDVSFYQNQKQDHVQEGTSTYQTTPTNPNQWGPAHPLQHQAFSLSIHY